MTLKVSNLSKRYNDKWILREVSLEVEPGSILGIAGPNTAGKSTLLRLLHGAEKPNSGEIRYNDAPLTDAVLVENKTAKSRWNIFTKSGGCSTSEEQATLFEQTLAEARSVVLVDNPFSGLDGYRKPELREKLQTTVREKNLAGIVVSCDDGDLFAVCDRIAVLADGYISQTASPRELYERPASVAAARALGACNLITARRVTFNNQASLEFQTLTGDHRLQVDKTERAALGAITNNVTLAIRPEHISLSFGASFPEDNLLKAEIVKIDYHGATTSVRLNANGLLLDALVLRLVGLNVGDQCMVGLPPDRILVLKS